MHEDGSCEVSDDGRGMPVDIHPEEKIPGVELILTRLHAGGKFSNKNYTFSGGLHGVGVSVVNALSKHVDVFIKRDGNEYRMSFKDGDRAIAAGSHRQRRQEEHRHPPALLADPKYFDTPKFNLRALKHLLRAKAVLCPGLTVTLFDEASGERDEWHYEDGLRDYLKGELAGPRTAAAGTVRRHAEEGHRDRRLGGGLDRRWRTGAGKLRQPDPDRAARHPRQRPAHRLYRRAARVLRFPQPAAARRQAGAGRRVGPRGVRAVAEDDRPAVQRADQGALVVAPGRGFVEGAAHDAFSLWLNQHTEFGEKIAQLAIERASARLKTEKQIVRKKVTQGPHCPASWPTAFRRISRAPNCSWSKAIPPAAAPSQARDKDFQAILPLRGKILNTWEVASGQVLASQEVHDLAVAIGCDPGKDAIDGLRYGKVVHPGRRRLRRPAHRHPALGVVPQALPVTGRGRPRVRGDAAAVPRRRGQAGVLRAGRRGKAPAAGEDRPRETQGPVNVTRFKGLGEMNPQQLRESTMHVDTRRLVQLTVDDDDATRGLMDMLLAKKRAGDRKSWLEQKGDLATLEV
jgi:topoisomerase-4 subunit B